MDWRYQIKKGESIMKMGVCGTTAYKTSATGDILLVL